MGWNFSWHCSFIYIIYPYSPNKSLHNISTHYTPRAPYLVYSHVYRSRWYLNVYTPYLCIILYSGISASTVHILVHPLFISTTLVYPLVYTLKYTPRSLVYPNVLLYTTLILVYYSNMPKPIVHLHTSGKLILWSIHVSALHVLLSIHMSTLDT